MLVFQICFLVVGPGGLHAAPKPLDDFVLIEADHSGARLAISDIPRDFSGPLQAGFKLLKPDIQVLYQVQYQ